MARVMFIDTARYLWFGIIAGVCGVILFGALLLGFLGPSAHVHLVDYAYDCPNDSHTFTSSCSGVQLGERGVYIYDLPQLNTMNGFWSTIVYPYVSAAYQGQEISSDLMVQVSISARKSTDEAWTVVEESQLQSEVLLCEAGQQVCWGFVLVYEDTIRHPFYRLTVSFPENEGNNVVAKQYIGDVAFEYQWSNEAFIELEMSLRVFFLVLGTAMIFLYWLRMRTIPTYEWSLEQWCVAALLVALILLNNPLYPFEYVVPGGFFPVVDCFFQVVHLCVLFLYWLMVFDYMRRGSTGAFIVRGDWIKAVVVGVYGIVTFVLFVWFRVVDRVDPVFGDTQSIWGLVILFFLDAALYGGIVVWVMFLMVLGISVVRQEAHLLSRFLMAAVPGLLVITSLIIALFFGVFGPVARTAPSFVYFYTLYNLYVVVLLIGYWPVESHFREAGAVTSENTPFAGATFSSFQKGPDADYDGL